MVVLLLFISHSRAVFSDPGIVPLPAHPIDFSDEHQQGPDGKRGTKSNTESIPCGLLTNQTPPDEGNANVLYECLILYTLISIDTQVCQLLFSIIYLRLDNMYKMRNVSTPESSSL